MVFISSQQLPSQTAEEPWVGNDHLKLQKLSKTDYPVKGQTFDVKVKVQSAAANGHVKFTLSGVSDWEGHAMNAGTESDDDPDLKLLTADQTESQGGTTLNWSAPPAKQGEAPAQKISAAWKTKTPTPSFTVKVRIYDYAAYGTLTAQLFYSGGQRGEDVSISLPRDDKGNNIADGWQNDKTQNYTDSADDERGPSGNTHHGDGFSVFEEYRGFKQRGTYARLDPSKKEVLVYVTPSLSSFGLGFATGLPDPIIPLRINWDEMDQPISQYVVNFKGTDVPGRELQRALKVLEDANANQYFGFTPPRTGQSEEPLYPNKVDACKIHTNIIEDEYPDPTFTQAQRDKVTQQTIGHEIGHGINLNYCQKYADPQFVGKCIMLHSGNPLYSGDAYHSHHYPYYRFKK